MEINIGINEADRKKIADGLSRVLADSYTLYLKTHFYHWNVTGPMFQTLHLMFEKHYTELALAVDDIAERIRAVGHFAPGTYVQFKELSSIKEDSKVPDAMTMLKNLVEGHEAVVRTARAALEPAEAANDQASLEMLSGRIALHEKEAWMLRSMLA